MKKYKLVMLLLAAAAFASMVVLPVVTGPVGKKQQSQICILGTKTISAACQPGWIVAGRGEYFLSFLKEDSRALSELKFPKPVVKKIPIRVEPQSLKLYQGIVKVKMSAKAIISVYANKKKTMEIAFDSLPVEIKRVENKNKPGWIEVRLISFISNKSNKSYTILLRINRYGVMVERGFPGQVTPGRSLSLHDDTSKEGASHITHVRGSFFYMVWAFSRRMRYCLFSDFVVYKAQRLFIPSTLKTIFFPALLHCYCS